MKLPASKQLHIERRITMLETFTKKISDFLIIHSTKKYSEDEIEVIHYGILCFFNMFIPITLIFLFAVMLHSTIGFFFWFFSFNQLRIHIGGYHAATQIQCMVLSTLLGVFSIFISVTLPPIVSILILIIYSFFIITIFFLAPIESREKPLSIKKRQQERFLGVIICTIELFIALLLPAELKNYTILGSSGATILMIIGKWTHHNP